MHRYATDARRPRRAKLGFIAVAWPEALDAVGVRRPRERPRSVTRRVNQRNETNYSRASGRPSFIDVVVKFGLSFPVILLCTNDLDLSIPTVLNTHSLCTLHKQKAGT